MGQSVECRNVFEWTCDECGRDNIQRSIKKELSAEEELKIKLANGIPLDEEGGFEYLPDYVTCKFCEAEFEAHYPGVTECEDDGL